MPARPAYAAVVLDGGRSRRMGVDDKPSLRVGDRTLRAGVVDAVADAERVLLVGPPSDDDAGFPDRVRRIAEAEPYGGPLPALAAAVPLIEQPVVVVLAADLVAIDGVPSRLRDALEADPEAEVAVAVDQEGRRQWLAAAYRTDGVRRALDSLDSIDAVHGRRFGDLVDLLRTVEVRLDIVDVDTPDDLARLRDAR